MIQKILFLGFSSNQFNNFLTLKSLKFYSAIVLKLGFEGILATYGVIDSCLKNDGVHINIFNIHKVNIMNETNFYLP